MAAAELDWLASSCSCSLFSRLWGVRTVGTDATVRSAMRRQAAVFEDDDRDKVKGRSVGAALAVTRGASVKCTSRLLIRNSLESACRRYGRPDPAMCLHRSSVHSLTALPGYR